MKGRCPRPLDDGDPELLRFIILIKQSVWALIITCANVPKYKGCVSLRKEVIQPQVPLGLPCYDFTPVMNHTVVIAIPERLS